MRLHKERAVEQGAEGGVIPAPPQPETTHLQTMMEKQKRLYSPSRMPPPELRRRAEVLTLSPDELKGKGDVSPGSAPVQRFVTSGTEPPPPVAPPERAIEEADTSSLAAVPESLAVQQALPDVAAPESPTVQPVMPDAAAPPALQRQVTSPSETTPSAVNLSVGRTELSVPSAQTTIQTQAEPAVTPQSVQPVMKESVVTETPMGSATPTVTPSDAAALPIPTASTPIQRQMLTPPTTGTPDPIVVPTAEIAQPPDVTPAAAETPVQRSLAEPLTTSATPRLEAHPTEATSPSDSSTPVAGAKPSKSEVTPTVQRQETTSSGELVEATTPAMPIISSASPAHVPATPAIQRQELPTSKPMTPVTATPGDKPAVSHLTEETATGQPSAVHETAATYVQRQTMGQEQAETLSVMEPLEPPTMVMPSTSPGPVGAPLPDEGSQRLEQPSISPTPTTSPAVQRQVDSLQMVAEVGELHPPVPQASQPLPAVTPVQRSSANEPASLTVDIPLPVVRARPVSNAVLSPATNYQRTAETNQTTEPDDAIMSSVGLERAHSVQRAAATPLPSASPLATPMPGAESVTPVQRAATTPAPAASPLATPMPGAESVMPIHRAAATPLPAASPLATPMPGAESVMPVPRAATTPLPTASPLATPMPGAESVTPIQRAAATPLPDVLPVTRSEVTAPVQRAAAPISPPGELDETEMPTMIMPVSTVASQSAPVPAETIFSPVVARTNQGAEPSVQRQVEPVSPTVTSRSPEISRPTQPPAIPPTERLALEDVWPVQRKETGSAKAGDLPVDPVEVAEPVRHEKPEAAQIQQVMRQVAAAKTSDSSVELILPRRQRPHVPPRPATSPPVVQTQPAPPATKDGNGQNRYGDGSSMTPQAYVPTEIGPLPGDLWEILGAPVPAPIRPTGQTDSPALMRAVAAAEQPQALAEPPPRYASVTATNGSTNGHPAPVQREPTTPNSETGQSQPSSVATVQSGLPTRTAAAQEGGEGGEQGEVNVEELARQVYSEVKRRLAIDWERGRGRF